MYSLAPIFVLKYLRHSRLHRYFVIGGIIFPLPASPSLQKHVFNHSTLQSTIAFSTWLWFEQWILPLQLWAYKTLPQSRGFAAKKLRRKTQSISRRTFHFSLVPDVRGSRSEIVPSSSAPLINTKKGSFVSYLNPQSVSSPLRQSTAQMFFFNFPLNYKFRNTSRKKHFLLSSHYYITNNTIRNCSSTKLWL